MTSTVAAVTQAQSLAAIRNFIRASVSCITYSRGLCSDDSFERRPFLGIELRHMVPITSEALAISEWIEKGAFDALRKNYLKEMSLCVYNRNCSELLESYCFGFSYSSDGQRAKLSLTSSHGASQEGSDTRFIRPAFRKRRCTKQEVQQVLVDVLTKLVEVVESLPPLLSDRVLTMRLTYYDETTPSNYEPPCFAPASDHMVRLYKDEQQYNVNIGSMDTSHHLFSVSIRHPLLAQVHHQHAAEYEKIAASTLNSWAAESAALSATMDTSAAHRDGAAGTEYHDPSSREAADELHPGTVRALRSLQQLVDTCAPLCSCDVAVLLVVCFAMATAMGARGRLTFTDLQDFLRNVCPVPISVSAATAVMDRLVAEGYAQTHRNGSVAKKYQSSSSKRKRSCSAAAESASPLNDDYQTSSVSYWILATPPIAFLERLLNQRQVTELLPPAIHAQLEKQRIATAKVRPPKSESHGMQRISCADIPKKRARREKTTEGP